MYPIVTGGHKVLLSACSDELPRINKNQLPQLEVRVAQRIDLRLKDRGRPPPELRAGGALFRIGITRRLFIINRCLKARIGNIS